MVLDIPYVSLTHTLLSVKQQVRDSLPYIHQYIPRDIEDPEQLFYYLKDRTKFKKDPNNDEWIRTVQTLFNKYNGRGDCDCFTVLSLTSFIYLGYKPMYVMLSGATPVAPTHIYTAVYDRGINRIATFDLTNPDYDHERTYNFKQRLLFQL